MRCRRGKRAVCGRLSGPHDPDGPDRVLLREAWSGSTQIGHPWGLSVGGSWVFEWFCCRLSVWRQGGIYRSAVVDRVMWPGE